MKMKQIIYFTIFLLSNIDILSQNNSFEFIKVEYSFNVNEKVSKRIFTILDSGNIEIHQNSNFSTDVRFRTDGSDSTYIISDKNENTYYSIFDSIVKVLKNEMIPGKGKKMNFGKFECNSIHFELNKEDNIFIHGNIYFYGTILIKGNLSISSKENNVYGKPIYKESFIIEKLQIDDTIYGSNGKKI